MKHTEQIRITAPFHASGVTFELASGELVDVRLSREIELKAECLRRFRRWAGIRFETPIEAGSAVDLMVDVVGEAFIHLADDRVRWIPVQDEARLLKAAEKHVDEVMGLLCLRSDDAATDQVKAKARNYFASLDRRTNAILGMVDPAMVAPMRALYETLLGRIRQRVEASSENTCRGALRAHESSCDVRQVSALMLGTMAESFGAPLRSPERIARIGAAHDIFSWGGLFLRSTQPLVERPNTSPDGAAIFMFPEFVHLAIEMGIDAEDWTALLPMLTRMPAIYLKVHELANPLFGPRPFGDYGHPPEVDVSETELVAYAEALASRYCGLSQRSLSDELVQLAKRAFTEV